MATNIGNLAATLSLNAGGFKRGLNDAMSRSKMFSGKMAVMAGAVAGVVGAIATSLISFVSRAVESMKRLVIDGVRESFRHIDELAKLSHRLGIGIQALAGLEHGAKLAGLEFEAMAKAVQRMQVGIGEAARGLGEAKRALEVLRLDAAKLQRMKPEEQLFTILNALDGLSATQRVSLAADIFGQRGLAILQTDARSLAQAMRERQALAGTITEQMAKNIERANDSSTRLKAAWEGITNELANFVSPSVATILESIAIMLVHVREIGKWLKFLSPALTAISTFNKLSEKYGGLVLTPTGMGFRLMPSPFSPVTGGMDPVPDTLESIDSKLGQMLDRFSDTAASLNQIKRDSEHLARRQRIN